MKAQRRHELKESDLAHALHVARRYLDENSRQVTIAVVLVGAVVAAVLFTVRSRAAALEDVWRRKAQLTFEDPAVGRESLASLATMTQRVSDERFVFASLVEQGQEALRLADEVSAPPDPEFNQRAREAFEKLLNRFPANPMARGIARLGLTTVAENAFILTGDYDQRELAREHLTSVVDDPALNGMPFQRLASDRLASLDSTFTRVDFVYTPQEQAPASAERAAEEPMDAAETQFEPFDVQAEPVEAADTDEVQEDVDAPDTANAELPDAAQEEAGQVEPPSESTP